MDCIIFKLQTTIIILLCCLLLSTSNKIEAHAPSCNSARASQLFHLLNSWHTNRSSAQTNLSFDLICCMCVAAILNSRSLCFVYYMFLNTSCSKLCTAQLQQHSNIERRNTKLSTYVLCQLLSMHIYPKFQTFTAVDRSKTCYDLNSLQAGGARLNISTPRDVIRCRTFSANERAAFVLMNTVH